MSPLDPSARGGADRGRGVDRRRVLILAGTLLSAALLALAASRLDWQRLRDAAEQATLWPWLIVAVMCYAAGQVARGLRCRLLVSQESALTLTDGTHVVVLGYAINNLLPARMGELARAGMLAERSGLPYVQSLTVTFLERLLDGLSLILLYWVASLAEPFHRWMATPLATTGAVLGVAGAATILAVTATILAVTAPAWMTTFTSQFAIRVLPNWHDGLLRATNGIVNGVAYLRRPDHALVVAGLSLGIWLVESTMFLAALHAFGLPPNPVTAILIMAFTNLSLLMTWSPGFIGPFHSTCTAALLATGAPPHTAASYAAAVHFAFYLPITLWGLGIMWSYCLPLSKAASLRQRARPLSTTQDVLSGLTATRLATRERRSTRGRPSRFMRDLVSALLPPEAEQGKDAAVDGVAQFVHDQMAALPKRLGLLFQLGMFVFRMVTSMVHLRGFSRLSPANRRRWVEGFAYGPLPPARQLFRGVRTTALLAYYELDDTIPAQRSAVTSSMLESHR